MRVLLDECVPRRLRTHFTGPDVHTVPEMGWSSKKDGDGFEVLVTVDKSIRHQQNLQAAGIAVVVLVALTNRLADLIPRVPGAMAALITIQPGDVVEITT